jgi:hypothetical protein
VCPKHFETPGLSYRVFDEMNVSFPLRPRPSTTSKKMQPAGNIGSEPAENSRKGNLARQ